MACVKEMPAVRVIDKFGRRRVSWAVGGFEIARVVLEFGLFPRRRFASNRDAAASGYGGFFNLLREV